MKHERKARKPHMDQVDAEALSAFMETRGWRLFHDRVTKMLFAHRATLELDAGEAKTASTRGAIAALRGVLKIPDILLQEAKASAATQAREEE